MTLRYPKTRDLGPSGSFSAPAWWTLILPEESKRHNLKRWMILSKEEEQLRLDMEIQRLKLRLSSLQSE
ncbi:hypothetical protein SETIT_9G055300v2 [Setaria italica]|uniref:Uncharacterized protein n=1 Tax=Setaria italica TaxID=4555 RepID=A0A368SDD9_SETIT|nr:hypothetical protein SETIT_9G055300v2 [Setaria italica]